MEHGFWLARWTDNRIGFHEAEGSALLRQHSPEWLGEAAQGQRVLVPLCGKTQDLHWLAARSLDVVGVEFVPTAVEQFFAEAGLRATTETIPPGTRSTAGPLSIWCADFFALGPEQIGRFPLIYDRAALVALPPDRRPAYATHLRKLAAPGARLLLLTFAYAGTVSGTPGPPFCVPDDEVRELYGPHGTITRLHTGNVDGIPGGLVAAGVTQVTETLWLIELAG